MAENDGPILVIGATGQQGGAVARELLRRGHEVHALTRHPDSPAAAALRDLGAQVVRGDLDDPDSLRSAMAPVRAMFSVQTITGGAEAETAQGRAVAEIAKLSAIEHVVYSSVDGAERRSGVPHFESKRSIERCLRALGMPTTILRPTSFIDNFTGVASPDLVDGALVVRVALSPDTPLQMVATADVGVVAADAFERPEEHIGEAIALAGDELTGRQIAAVFEGVSGIPARFERQPLEEIRAISADVALMFEWLEECGYEVDIASLRERCPDLRTLRSWLEESGWRAGVPA